MADTRVTDPALLAQLNASAPTPVADPAILAKLNETKPQWSGSILPVSVGPDGKAQFDSNAGILGMAKRVFSAPKEVYEGTLDPKSDDGIARAAEMAMAISQQAPGMRGQFIPGELASTRKTVVPTTQELYDAASGQFNKARETGVEYTSTSVKSAADRLRGALEGDGIYEELAPQTFGAINKLQSPPADSFVPYVGLDAARKYAQRAGKNFNNPTEQEASHRVVAGLDEFLQSAPRDPAALRASTSPEAAQTVADLNKAARGNWAAAKRADGLAGIEDAADLRAAAANSGLNGDNAIRSRIAGLLLSPKRVAGYSPEEIQALTSVVEGGPVRNATRGVANLLGGGGGLGSIATGAAAAAPGLASGNAPLAAAGAIAAPAIGFFAKKLQNSLATGALNKAEELVRQRSPLYRQRVENPPEMANDPSARDALIRALMFHYTGTGQQ